MGLAASQCRFLMLTSRESDVEAKLMALSNQQMALSNKATKLSTDYAKALSAQDVNFNDKMVCYASIMNPNTVQNADGIIPQHLFKTSKGAVVLSPGKASLIGLKDPVGTGYDFRQMFKTKDDFLKRVMSGYKADFGTNGSSSASAPTISESGYKYTDSIMNNAVVSVTSASVLKLSGYGFEDLEFAMGTQEKDLGSYACIWTLDQYQYTDATVHSVVNSFVEDAIEAMGEQCLSENTLGSSDAVNYAVNYAKQKTAAYYKDVSINATQNNVVQELETLDGKKQATSSTKINVSTGVYTTTTESQADGNIKRTVTQLTGKDIFVDTAQLTATFLNFFDAGMMYAMADNLDQGNISLTDKEVKLALIKNKLGDSYNAKTYESMPDSLLEKNLKQVLGTEYETLSATPNGLADKAKEIKIAEFRDLGDKIFKLNVDDNDTLKDNVLTARLANSGDKGLDGVNGYNKSVIDSTYTSASTGCFGNTQNTGSASSTNSSTNNSTITAQKAFYGYMYDALCANGWSMNSSVTDNQYLSDQMQRQNIVLYEYSSSSTKSKNGEALSLDDSQSGLTLVDSNDRLEAAQAAYEAESAKIDYKTSIISTQMDKLNTELTSIQSEKESVKAIIDKRLEKFSLFG